MVHAAIANVMHEGVSKLGWCACMQTLTPLQMARCVVKAFPWYPDIPAITIWISAQHGDPAARAQLRTLLPNGDL